MLCRSGMAKLVRTPAVCTTAAAGRGRPFTSTPRSVVVPPVWPEDAQRTTSSLHPQACTQQTAAVSEGQLLVISNVACVRCLYILFVCR